MTDETRRIRKMRADFAQKTAEAERAMDEALKVVDEALVEPPPAAACVDTRDSGVARVVRDIADAAGAVREKIEGVLRSRRVREVH